MRTIVLTFAVYLTTSQAFASTAALTCITLDQRNSIRLYESASGAATAIVKMNLEDGSFATYRYQLNLVRDGSETMYSAYGLRLQVDSKGEGQVKIPNLKISQEIVCQ